MTCRLAEYRTLNGVHLALSRAAFVTLPAIVVVAAVCFAFTATTVADIGSFAVIVAAAFGLVGTRHSTTGTTATKPVATIVIVAAVSFAFTATTVADIVSFAVIVAAAFGLGGTSIVEAFPVAAFGV